MMPRIGRIAARPRYPRKSHGYPSFIVRIGRGLPLTFQPPSHAQPPLHLVSDALVERDDLPVAGAHLQVDLRTAERPQACLRRANELRAESAPAVLRRD